MAESPTLFDTSWRPVRSRTRAHTAEERFWAKVDKNGPMDVGGLRCWIWTGSADRKGYGRFRVDGETRICAHRFAYELVVGPIAHGLDLDHLCRNPSCVRSEHLEPVTRQENNRRSGCVGTVNAAKTHCINGHEFTAENTYIRPSKPERQCRICNKKRRQEYLKRKAAQ